MGLLDLIPVIGQVIDRVIPDPAQKAQLQLQLAQIADQEAARAHEENMGQIQTNIAETNTRSMFIGGWRPFIGWGLGTALIYNTLFAPLLHTGQADLSFLQTILMGMLGLGAMRSFDKAKGTSNDTPFGNVPKEQTVNKEAGQPAVNPPRKKFLGLF